MSLTFPLQNGTNLSFSLLLQNLTLVHQLLMAPNLVTLKTAGYIVPPGTSSQLPLTVSLVILPNTLPQLLSAALTLMSPSPHPFSIPLFGMTVLGHPAHVM